MKHLHQNPVLAYLHQQFVSTFDKKIYRAAKKLKRRRAADEDA